MTNFNTLAFLDFIPLWLWNTTMVLLVLGLIAVWMYVRKKQQ